MRYKLATTLVVVALLGFKGGSILANSESVSKLVTGEPIANSAEDNIHNILMNLKEAIKSKDVSTAKDLLVGDLFVLEKQDILNLMEMLSSEQKLNEFILKLENQIPNFMADKLKDNEIFTLCVKDNKVMVKVNKIDLKLYLKTQYNIVIDAKEYNSKKPLILESTNPLNVHYKMKVNDIVTDYRFNAVDKFLSNSGLSTFDFAIKRGVGLVLIVDVPQKGNLTINGEETDVNLEPGMHRVDGLKKGDTLRLVDGDNRSNEYKVREKNEMVELEYSNFTQPEIEASVTDVSSIGQQFLKSISDYVNQGNEDVLSLVDSNIALDLNKILGEYVASYGEMGFSNINMTSTSQSGVIHSINYSYSASLITMSGEELLHNGNLSIHYDESTGKITTFSI